MYRENYPTDELALAKERIAHRYSVARWVLRILRLVFHRKTPVVSFQGREGGVVLVRILHKGDTWYARSSSGPETMDHYTTWVNSSGAIASLNLARKLSAMARAKVLSDKFNGGGNG